MHSDRLGVVDGDVEGGRVRHAGGPVEGVGPEAVVGAGVVVGGVCEGWGGSEECGEGETSAEFKVLSAERVRDGAERLRSTQAICCGVWHAFSGGCP